VRARVGQWARAEEAGADRCRVRMETDVLDWAALVLGAVRAEFTVTAPAELREQLEEWAQRFSRAVTAPDVRR
jgi:predicted DNA-binding transcriptional regulator YafY